MITEFTPIASLLGGVLIGLAAVMLMVLNGRIAGMTGIFSGILAPFDGANRWRLAFLGGAVATPFAAQMLGAGFTSFAPVTGLPLVIGGLIVGIGVSYGGGCTSGHGVCGIARLSKRSIVATIVFMVTTFVTVTLMRHGV